MAGPEPALQYGAYQYGDPDDDELVRLAPHNSVVHAVAKHSCSTLVHVARTFTTIMSLHVSPVGRQRDCDRPPQCALRSVVNVTYSTFAPAIARHTGT